MQYKKFFLIKNLSPKPIKEQHNPIRFKFFIDILLEKKLKKIVIVRVPTIVPVDAIITLKVETFQIFLRGSSIGEYPEKGKPKNTFINEYTIIKIKLMLKL